MGIVSPFSGTLFSQHFPSGRSCQDEAENLLPTSHCHKRIEVDDERKLSTLNEKGMATEIAANVLDGRRKGCVVTLYEKGMATDIAANVLDGR